MDGLRAARLKFCARAVAIVSSYGALATGHLWGLAALFFAVLLLPVTIASVPDMGPWPSEPFPLPADVEHEARWQTDPR